MLRRAAQWMRWWPFLILNLPDDWPIWKMWHPDHGQSFDFALSCSSLGLSGLMVIMSRPQSPYLFAVRWRFWSGMIAIGNIDFMPLRGMRATLGES